MDRKPLVVRNGSYNSMRILRQLATLVLLLLFIGVLAAPSAQEIRIEEATTTPTLYVGLAPQPQPLSWLGFYDTLFPMSITVTVHNLSDKNFPGGNLTGFANSPSGKWSIPDWRISVPELPAGKSQTLSQPLLIEEAGVYTVSFTSIDLQTQQYWQVSGGFLVVQVEPPSTLYQSLTVILLAVIAVVLMPIVVLLWRRRRIIPSKGQRLEPPASMMVAFGMSEAGKKMESYLLAEKNNRKFESAVSWLLEILGFWTMKLNSESKGEFFKDGQQEIGSADILAYDPLRSRSLVVGCTVGIADTAALQRISNLAEKLAPHVGDCDPVLVSYESSELSKKDAEALCVILLDHTSLVSLVSLVRSQRFRKARRMLE